MALGAIGAIVVGVILFFSGRTLDTWGKKRFYDWPGTLFFLPLSLCLIVGGVLGLFWAYPFLFTLIVKAATRKPSSSNGQQ